MFRLERHIGTSLSTGREVEVNQWKIFFGDVLVGYLPQAKESQVLPLFEFPHEALTDDVLTEFAMLNAEKIGVAECVVTGPEQYSRRFVEQALAIKAAEENDDE